MNSINQQQPENNHADLQSVQAIKKMKDLCEKKACFFCTSVNTGQPFQTRPMSVQQVDDSGALWFLSAADSGQNQEIAANPVVQLLFQGSPHSDFIALQGHATITRDEAKINELWEPVFKTWFTGGQNDSRITVIKVQPHNGYYWDTKHGSLVSFAKQLIGAATGKTLDDSVEGKLTV